MSPRATNTSPLKPPNGFSVVVVPSASVAVLVPPAATVTLTGVTAVAGGALTTSVNDCVVVPRGFEAMIVKVNEPPVPAVPARVAVPSPLSLNVTPAGNPAPTASMTGTVPVVEIVNVPATPCMKVVVLALVKKGAAGISTE